MVRHWTLDLVSLAGIAAGFVLFAAGQTPLVAGVVAAASAYAVVLSESFAALDESAPAWRLSGPDATEPTVRETANVSIPEKTNPTGRRAREAGR